MKRTRRKELAARRERAVKELKKGFLRFDLSVSEAEATARAVTYHPSAMRDFQRGIQIMLGA